MGKKLVNRRFWLMFLLVACVSMSVSPMFGAPPKKASKSVPENWVTIVDDGMSTISYNPNITRDRDGNYVVWVKTVFHTSDWQWYMAEQAGLNTPVVSTKTKAMYTSDLNYALVRQVLCFSKTGKQLYNSGDDTSAGWYPVNASDPVGIVGEYLERNRDSW